MSKKDTRTVTMAETPTDTAAEARAPKRTPRRAIEEAGFGIWWGNLTPADKSAVAAHLFDGDPDDTAAAVEAAKRKAEEMVKSAEAKHAKAVAAAAAYRAVLDKCAALQRTLEGK